MFFIVLFTVGAMFSTFKIFSLISPKKIKYLEYSHQISPQKSEKYTKITVGLKKKIGRMLLRFMSGTFKHALPCSLARQDTYAEQTSEVSSF